MARKRSRIDLTPDPMPAAILAREPDTGVPLEKQFFSLGLPTLDPTKKNPPPRFGEFLQCCRWCKRNIRPNINIYMYGFLGAYCSPECRERRIKLDTYFEKLYSKSGSSDKGTEGIKER